MENVMYTAVATAEGGREGHVKTSDGMLDFELRHPKEMGGEGGTTNPEQLFAAGYAACFNSALNLAARMKHIDTKGIKVKVSVSIGKNDAGGFRLGARIDAVIPGVDQAVADELIQKAHTICPYSNATRGNIEVVLHAVTK